MLASSHRYYAHPFLPAVPSPLSPRSANIDASPHAHAFFTHSPVYMSDASSTAVGKENTIDNQSDPKAASTNAFTFTFQPPSACASRSTPQQPQTYAQRARTAKKAPLPQQNELRDRRRDAFLRKVRSTRDDERWEARGDDVLRAEWMRERRAREEELAGSAPEVEGEEMIDAEEDMRMQSEIEKEAEEWAGWEEGELEALIGMAPGEEGEEEERWSDGDDFWEEFLREREGGEQAGSSRQPQQQGVQDVQMRSTQDDPGEAMDVS